MVNLVLGKETQKYEIYDFGRVKKHKMSRFFPFGRRFCQIVSHFSLA